MSNIIEETLSNGIRVVIDPSSSAKALAVGFAFNIGSRYETEAENGLCHLLEHNIFRGTDKYTSQQILLRAADIGANFNAYTNKDITNYHMIGMSRYSNDMIDLLGDIVTRSIFPETEFELEREAVIEEIKMQQDRSERRLYNRATSLMYPNQPLGRTVLGPINNISAIPRQMMVDFFKENYNTGTMIVSIAGEIEPAAALQKLEHKLAEVPVGNKRVFEAATFGKPIYDHIQRDDMNQIITSILYRGLKESHKLSPALMLGSQMLGGDMNSRLFENVRSDRGLAYAISSGTGSYQDTGVLSINFSCSPEKAESAMTVIKETIDNFLETMSEQELNRAKAQLSTGRSLSQETVETRMDINAYFKSYKGHAMSVEKGLAELAPVTLEDVKKTLRATLHTKPIVVTIGKHDIAESYQKFTL